MSNIKPIPIKALDKQHSDIVSFIPKSSFIALIVAARGGGKSTTILNMLLNEELLNQQYHKVLIISPTASLDDKFNILKQVNIVKSNKELVREILKRKKKAKNRILDNVNTSRDEAIIEIMENRPLEDTDFLDDISFSFLEPLINEQRYLIETYGKKLCNKVLLIFDDTMTFPVWKQPHIIRMIFNSRHLNISSLIVTQSYFCCPKSIRQQAGIKMIYDVPNLKENQLIYEENPVGLNYKTWMNNYSIIKREPYSFMLINTHNKKPYQMAHSFMKWIDTTENEI